MAEINEVQLWNQTLAAAMKLPMVAVNRKEFLTKELSIFCSPEQVETAIASKPSDVLTKEQIGKIANGVIKYHLTVVTATSSLAGIPGGWFIAGTIPADLAQFYGHVLSMAQKLMYLYGFPDFQESNGKLSDEALQILTLAIGVMSGATAAANAFKQVLNMLAENVVKQLPKQALTKSGIYVAAKAVAKWLGISLTKRSFAQGVGKFIPLVGAPISGALTYWTFRPMAYKLKRYLDSNYELLK
ncbi:MAG: hypothetical protein IKQ48_05425 [Paludibacteraceae bacterium]|nr:hypothetical protein [Paludibacteraceae bacterium]